MGRDELCITVPSLFRCPISLDLMKSPVSLCTGVTYDRSSIQHWLDSGHDTCPATMQVLSSKDFVPNLTLHRLINLWASKAPNKSPALAPAVSEEKVRVWIEEIKSGKIEMCLDSIVEFVSCGEVSRRFLVSFDDFLEAIVGVLNTNCDQIRVLESVIRVLSSILLENGVREKLHKLVFISNSNCLPSFISVLRNGSLEYSIACVTVLESITMNNQSKQFVAGTQDVLPVLVQLLKTENDHQDLNEAVMSFLISVSITRSIKTRLAQLGLVGALSNILLSQNAAVSVVEKSLKVLSIICTCADGRSAISVVDPICAGAIVERLMKVSKTATEDAVVVLWSMCCLFRDEKAQEKVAGSNGVAKVLLVMQSEVGEGNVRMMCGDLIKVLRLGCKNGGGHGGMVSYETKTTHIMPC